MKTIPEVLALIKARSEEHKKEIESSDNALKHCRLPGGQDRNSQLQNAAKMLILKDKIVFHKAAIAALQDLYEDINK